MQITIDETQTMRSIILSIKRQLLADLRRQGKSMTYISNQLEVSYKTLYNWINDPSQTAASSIKLCLFCATPDNLKAHHVNGKKNGPEITYLCDPCHKTFHALEIKFRSK